MLLNLSNPRDENIDPEILLPDSITLQDSTVQLEVGRTVSVGEIQLWSKVREDRVDVELINEKSSFLCFIFLRIIDTLFLWRKSKSMNDRKNKWKKSRLTPFILVDSS